MEDMIAGINEKIDKLFYKNGVSTNQIKEARSWYNQGYCQVLSCSKVGVDLYVQTGQPDTSLEVSLKLREGELICLVNGKPAPWNAESMAALLQAQEEMKLPDAKITEGKAYTRGGMIKRVLAERKAKAAEATYKIKFANNIYGEHELITEKGNKYFVLLRDFESETGYINNPDWQTNKLGTTKHIMYVFDKLKKDKKIYNRLSKQFPYLEIYTDPLNDYKITWHYPAPIPSDAGNLIKKYFGNKKFISPEKVKNFLGFIQAAAEIRELVIRPEVEEQVQLAWEKETLRQLEQSTKLDYSLLKVKLFPYQQLGVAFSNCKKCCIIAGGKGRGKTIQAIGVAVMKKKILGFKRTLIVCPASLKEQWKKEIEKFS
ncbi:MAG: SNF2-related protein, partial [Chitinophagaceae bacterium]